MFTEKGILDLDVFYDKITAIGDFEANVLIDSLSADKTIVKVHLYDYDFDIDNENLKDILQAVRSNQSFRCIWLHRYIS